MQPLPSTTLASFNEILNDKFLAKRQSLSSPVNWQKIDRIALVNLQRGLIKLASQEGNSYFHLPPMLRERLKASFASNELNSDHFTKEIIIHYRYLRPFVFCQINTPPQSSLSLLPHLLLNKITFLENLKTDYKFEEIFSLAEDHEKPDFTSFAVCCYEDNLKEILGHIITVLDDYASDLINLTQLLKGINSGLKSRERFLLFLKAKEAFEENDDFSHYMRLTHHLAEIPQATNNLIKQFVYNNCFPSSPSAA